MVADLRIGEAVVAVASVETWIARRLPFADAAEECLKGAVDTQHDILQDLSVDLAVFWHRFLDVGQLCLLLVVGDGNAAQTPRLAAFAHSGIVDVAAEHGGAVKRPLLLRGGLEFVLE
jgi:hypothetical protein